jgi:hypothetical protein
LTLDEIHKLIISKRVYVDSGKNVLLTMIDDDNNFVRFTAGERRSYMLTESYTKKRNKIK